MLYQNKISLIGHICEKKVHSLGKPTHTHFTYLGFWFKLKYLIGLTFQSIDPLLKDGSHTEYVPLKLVILPNKVTIPNQPVSANTKS